MLRYAESLERDAWIYTMIIVTINQIQQLLFKKPIIAGVLQSHRIISRME